MDSQAAHELSEQMRGLAGEVSGLRASFDIYAPMITGQVSGLADMQNRQTKLEARVQSIEERLKEDRESKRWFATQIVVATGAITAIVQVLISMAGHK